MSKPKHIDNIEMSFTDPQGQQPSSSSNPDSAAPTIAAEDLEELKEQGQLVYKKNKKTGDITFFVQDKEGKDEEVSIDVIDKLEKAYPTIPEYSYNGAKKKGEVQRRFVAEKYNEEKRAMEAVEVPEAEAEIISERQDYEDGEVITNSILKKYQNLVKMLRGEIGK